MALLRKDFPVKIANQINHPVYGFCKIKGIHARKNWINGLDLIPIDQEKLNLLISGQNKAMSRKSGGMAHMIGWFHADNLKSLQII